MKHLGLLKQFLLLFALIVGSTSVWADDTYTKVTSSDQISVGSKIIFVCEENSQAMQNDANYPGTEVTISNSTITLSSTTTVCVMKVGGEKNAYTFDVGTNELLSWKKNGFQINYTEGNADKWTINEDGSFICNVSGVKDSSTRTQVRHNTSNTNKFGCYTSSTGKAVCIYVKDEEATGPSITASNVNIDYNATSGNIAFTVNNEVSGGSVSASKSDNWITLGNETTSPISFTCSENEANTARTATVTLTYTYNTDETVTKNVTVTQAAAPVIYSTIPALFAAATSTETNVNVTFNNWVVSGVSTNGKNVFVTDGTNGFVIYSSSDQSSTYSVGDILSGTAVSCKLVLYNGFAEITNLDASDLTISNGGTVSVADIALADLAGVNTGALVSYENLTCSINSNKYYLSDGTTTIQLYNSLYDFGTLEAGKKYNITGIYQQYNDTKEILPRSANDIVEYVSTEPSIDVSTNKVEATAAETDGTITVTYNNITDIVAQVQFYDENGTTELTVNDVPSWIQAEIDGDNNVYYLIGENEGEARTAYMKVYALDDDGNDVYSELITVTQAKQATSYSLAKAIVPGKHYIIVGLNNKEYKAMGEQKNDNRGAVAITVKNNTASVADDEGVYEVRINVDNATGHYVLFDEAYNSNNGGYLYAAQGTSTGNNMRTEENLDSEGNGTWTIEIDATTGVATIKATNPNIERNTLRYNSGSSLFSCYKSGQRDIYLFERDNDDSPEQTTITVSPATDKTYTTFCRAIDLDFTNVSGIEAYVVSGLTESSASIKKVNKVPAGEGIILKRTGTDESFDIPFAESAEPIAKNYMVGVTKEKDMTNVTNAYILSGGLFYECNGGKLAAGKAYLNDENGVWAAAAAGAPSFSIIVDGETTGIENVKGEAITNSQYYTLDGRRVAAPTKGIYIVNGKKVVVK